MDPSRFDRITVELAATPSRRRLVLAAVASLLGRQLTAEAGGAANCRHTGERCGRRAGRCCSVLSCCNGRCRRTKSDPDNCGRQCRTCAPNEVCLDGRCVDHCQSRRKEASFGETDIDCGGPNCVARCGDGHSCLVDGDCNAGHCIDGICGCLEDIDCSSQPFPLAPFCVDNRCEQCGVDEHCTFDSSRPFCVDNFCVDCRTSADCPSSEPICTSSNSCTDRCRNTSDCPSGLRCCQGECVDVSDSVAHCGRCGNSCPGQFPSCVRCCDLICREFPRGGNPDCNCP